jgi:hypothetical protein
VGVDIAAFLPSASILGIPILNRQFEVARETQFLASFLELWASMVDVFAFSDNSPANFVFTDSQFMDNSMHSNKRRVKRTFMSKSKRNQKQHDSGGGKKEPLPLSIFVDPQFNSVPKRQLKLPKQSFPERKKQKFQFDDKENLSINSFKTDQAILNERNKSEAVKEAVLIVSAPGQKSRKIKTRRKMFSCGRSEKNSWVVVASVVSQQHFKLCLKSVDYAILKDKSTNGEQIDFYLAVHDVNFLGHYLFCYLLILIP